MSAALFNGRRRLQCATSYKPGMKENAKGIRHGHRKPRYSYATHSYRDFLKIIMTLISRKKKINKMEGIHFFILFLLLFPKNQINKREREKR